MKNYFRWLFRAYTIVVIITLYLIAIMYTKLHYGDGIEGVVMIVLAPFVIVTITTLFNKWLKE